MPVIEASRIPKKYLFEYLLQIFATKKEDPVDVQRSKAENIWTYLKTRRRAGYKRYAMLKFAWKKLHGNESEEC